MKRKNFKRAKAIRQEGALKRLESAYEKFKAGGEDKNSWTTTRNGGKRKVIHSGRTYNQECERFKREITILKEKMSMNF